MTSAPIEWSRDSYNDDEGAQLGDLTVLVIAPPPFGALSRFPHQWEVQAFVSDRNIADVVASGEADSMDDAKAAALDAAARLAR